MPSCKPLLRRVCKTGKVLKSAQKVGRARIAYQSNNKRILFKTPKRLFSKKKILELKRMNALGKNVSHSGSKCIKAIQFSATDGVTGDDKQQQDASKSPKRKQDDEEHIQRHLSDQQTSVKKMKKSYFDTFRKPRKMSNAKRRMLRDRRLESLQTHEASQDLDTSQEVALITPKDQCNIPATEIEFMNHHQEACEPMGGAKTEITSEQSYVLKEEV